MDNEKYSLRQRQKRKHILGRSNDCQGYASDNSTESLQNLSFSKSPSSNSSGKAKTKAAPLSKYRRKTANARERTRMREINSAFELLRHCVPTCITSEDAVSTNEKLTKITTLRMAMKYIGILSDALVNPHEADYGFLHDCTLSKPTDRGFIDELDEIEVDEPEPEPEKCAKREKTKNPKPKKSTTSKGTAPRKPTPLKRQHKKQKPEKVEAIITSPIPSLCQASPTSNASSAYASLSSSDASASPHSNSSYHFENSSSLNTTSLCQSRNHNSMSDLSNLMLESDGESLNLSERCLSPLHANHKPYSSVTTSHHHLYDCSPADIPTLENPLELSLRLMDNVVTDSLHLSPVPAAPPSSCFSPLLSLEPFNAFDLFHSDFNEQAALDLFLT